ncbi:MAG: phage holin family protein [Candidatus Eremiobacteraeota bacterium]|nr:phage holin family protein [Candidatus Eremiobacteraeota bacterium]
MTSESELREKSMSELLARLSRETTLLVRQEIDLAKAELAQQGRVVGAGAAMFGAGTVLGLGAFGALTATFILALALIVPAWLAALIVTIVYGAIAGVLALQAKQRVQRVKPAESQTVETLKENVEWAKSRMTSDNK